MQSLALWEPNPHIAVACSGGADSLALTLLAHHWAAHRGGKVSALIVDHGLRPESPVEVQQVQRWLSHRAIDSHILTVQLGKSDSAVQERARNARYEAMTQWCHAHNVKHLLLGHHADDQLETFIFRLLRGSGPDGLACMSMRREAEGICLLRPLLQSNKQECIAYLQEQAQPWIDDPSNEKPEFARVRIRQWLRQSVDSAQRERLQSLIQRFGYVRQYEDLRHAERITRYVRLYPCGIGWIDEHFLQQEQPTACKLLASVLTTVNGDTSSLRYQELSQLHHDLLADRTKTRSLHHCLLVAHQHGWLVLREPAHAEDKLRLKPNMSAQWDQRFQIITNDAFPDGYDLKPLGASGWQQLKGHRDVPSHLNRQAILSLPAIWHLEAPLFVPHISTKRPPWPKNSLSIRFTPAKALADAPFFIMNKVAPS